MEVMVITTSPLVKTYKLQEFWDLPEPTDRTKLELIKGVLYMSPPPGEIHDDVFGALNRELLRAIDRCGYKGTILSARAAVWTVDDTYLEPDLLYVSDELKHQLKGGPRTYTDIVVEILSPGSAVYDRKTKSDTYRAMGVREMWLADPETKEIEVRSFEVDKTSTYQRSDILRSAVLPEIQIPVASIFE
jgi:Uma2 family endonuclease